jgi:hypothetical protein
MPAANRQTGGAARKETDALAGNPKADHQSGGQPVQKDGSCVVTIGDGRRIEICFMHFNRAWFIDVTCR